MTTYYGAYGFNGVLFLRAWSELKLPEWRELRLGNNKFSFLNFLAETPIIAAVFVKEETAAISSSRWKLILARISIRGNSLAAVGKFLLRRVSGTAGRLSARTSKE